MDYFFNFEKIQYLTGKRPEGCILCLVKQKNPEVTDLTIYRTPLVLVSLNLYPYNPGHLLVFPARHVIDIRDLTQEERESMESTIQHTLNILDDCYHPEGYNIGCNMGLAAGASIEHLHYHIIPRYYREIGIAELIAGKRVLVENPVETRERLQKAFIEKEQ
jgi:ATP adenylyltransferase